MTVVWACVTAVSFVSPALLLFGWPVAGIAFAGVAIVALRALRRRPGGCEAVTTSRSRSTTVLLCLVALAAILGTVSACVPSLGFRSKHGVLVLEYGLSQLAAPACFAVTFIVAVWTLAAPTLRRLSIIVAATLCTWPFLVAIRVLREPLFDIDDQHVVLMPWAVFGYVAAVAAISGAAIALLTEIDGRRTA